MLARSFLILAAGLVLHAGVLAQPAVTPSAAVRGAWNFDGSDLTPHPGVRFGVLPNGMRYALAPNAVSRGGLSVRLHVDAGSTAEGLREQGHMHLIEHLIFEGSVNLPKGALPLMLHHQGLRRWSDFNAFTSYDETVYRLDLAKSDGGARATALMLMREIASHLGFTRKTVDGAKVVVVQELGARDAVQDRIMTAKNAFFIPEAPIARGPVAGTQASIRRARRGALRRLYARTYVPQRTTLVVAGDFEPATVEAELAARFADWRGVATTAADAPTRFTPRRRGVEARLFVDPTAPTSIAIATVEPLGAADGGRRRDAVFLEHLGAQMLSRRLERMAAESAARFLSGTSAVYDHFSTARLSTVDVVARGRDWRSALRAGARELGRALKDGFSPSELETQLGASRSALAGDAAPPTSQALADQIADAVGRRIVFTAPSDRSATAAYLARVSLADVNTAFKAAWASPSRLIFVTHHRPIPDAEAAIAAAWIEEPQPAGAAPDWK